MQSMRQSTELSVFCQQQAAFQNEYAICYDLERLEPLKPNNRLTRGEKLEATANLQLLIYTEIWLGKV